MMSDSSPPTFSEHSNRFQEMAARTDRYGAMEKADGHGQASSLCGDKIEFFLRLGAGRLQLVTFQVRGCIHMVACGNSVSHLVEGRTVAEAWQLKASDIIDYLQTLAEEQHHCADLAASALFAALTDCQRLAREPWKKLYRRF